jgi:hypothetical protein
MPAPVYVGVIVSRECSPKRLQVLLHHPTEVPGDSQKVTTPPIVAARQALQQFPHPDLRSLTRPTQNPGSILGVKPAAKLPEVTLCEGMPRTVLEVGFKIPRSLRIREEDRCDKFPGAESSRMSGLA